MNSWKEDLGGRKQDEKKKKTKLKIPLLHFCEWLGIVADDDVYERYIQKQERVKPGTQTPDKESVREVGRGWVRRKRETDKKKGRETKRGMPRLQHGAQRFRKSFSHVKLRGRSVVLLFCPCCFPIEIRRCCELRVFVRKID